MCSVDGCNGLVLAKGYCSSHYLRWRKHGDPLKGKFKSSERTGRKCSVADCDSGVWCRGFCMKHYQRWKQHGDPCRMLLRSSKTKSDWVSQSGVCLVDGCTNQREARGYCQNHYYRLRRYGDPLKGGRSQRESGQGTFSNGYHFSSVKREGIWRQVGTHRLVMERKIGRPLRKNENVHHINGDRSDNRPENLELWVKTQPCGQRIDDLVAWAKEVLMLYEHEVG